MVATWAEKGRPGCYWPTAIHVSLNFIARIRVYSVRPIDISIVDWSSTTREVVCPSSGGHLLPATPGNCWPCPRVYLRNACLTSAALVGRINFLDRERFPRETPANKRVESNKKARFAPLAQRTSTPEKKGLTRTVVPFFQYTVIAANSIKYPNSIE